MARPTKEGLEYFPLDVDIDQDEKLIVVIAKFGMRGFGVIIRLMMGIYKNGYFYPWTEKEQYIFSMKVAEPVEYVNEVVQECLKWGFFHQEMFETYGILTSKGFQKRYSIVTNRRKGPFINHEHNLIDDVIADNNSINVNNNSDNDDDNATKESKVKKNKSYKDMSIYGKIISFLNDKAGKNFSAKSEANKKLINGRMSEGRTLEDFYHVINVKCEQWLEDPKMNEFLRPSTLFAQKNFENYVNEKPKQQQPKQRDSRDKDIEFQRWIAEGNDPNAFDWRT